MRRRKGVSRLGVSRLGGVVLATWAASYAGCAQNPETEPPLPSVDAPRPPAVSGGTLLVARDGRTAIAADPERDVVWVVDLIERRVRQATLEPGDEPGRAAQDSADRVHVVARGGSAVVTLDPASATVIERREVCPAPRGITFDEQEDVLHVACAGGELVTLPSSGGPAVRTLRLSPDLRDVVVAGDGLAVSRFRAADLVLVGPDGEVSQPGIPPVFKRSSSASLSPDPADFSPNVAWRTAALPGGGFAMVHQRGQDQAIPLDQPSGYAPPIEKEDGEPCADGIVHSAVTLFDAAAQPVATAGLIVPEATLPVDVAVSPQGDRLAIVGAGSRTVTELGTDEYRSEAGPSACTAAVRARHRIGSLPAGADPAVRAAHGIDGTPVAAAYTNDGALVVQVRSPPSLVLVSKGGQETIELPAESMDTPGHMLFHAAAQGSQGLACASCHPEGGDDGRTWRFSPIGARRTQYLRGGGILSSAPFHWDGDQASLDHLVSEVLVRRMGGPEPLPGTVADLGAWLEAQPRVAPSPPEDVAAAERGRALFESPALGCTTCHSGALRSDNRSADVGKGMKVQTPRLLDLAQRAPFMHDGCAATLRDRFDPACGGAAHGNTSHLADADIDDLVAYLETL